MKGVKMDIIGVLGLAFGAIGVAVSVIAIVQSAITTKRQNIHDLRWKLSTLINVWIVGIRKAVKKESSTTFNDVKEQIEEFKHGNKDTRQLPVLQEEIKRYPEFKEVNEKLDAFWNAAVNTKEGVLIMLGKIIANHSQMTTEEYQKRTEKVLEQLEDAYDEIINELSKIK